MGMLVGAVLLDLKSWRIPNSYIILCGITSINILWEKTGAWGCSRFLLQLLWPIVLLYGIYLIGGLGAGDIKLLGVISTLMDCRSMLRLIAVSMVIGAVYGLLRFIKLGQLREVFRSFFYLVTGCPFHQKKFNLYYLEKREHKIHFTVCILIAFVWCVCKEGVV